MIKSALVILTIITLTTTSPMSSPSRINVIGDDCSKLHHAINNQIETIYLVQMAEFWATRTKNVEGNPELSIGISAAIEEIVEALGHYDGAGTRHAIDVVLKLCPL